MTPSNTKKQRKWYVTLLKIIGSIFIVILLFGVVVLSFFTIVEYRPKDVEEVKINNNPTNKVALNVEYNALTFNIGYGALGVNEDFVMDGGKQGVPKSKDIVEGYLTGIENILIDNPCDIYFLQEVDLNSRRSFKINECVQIANKLGNSYSNTFAYNYKALFVPFPFSFTEHMGRVESGMTSYIKFNTNEAKRYQFPGAFAWPGRTANLKRGMLVNYLPIEGSNKYLVVINVHLSAYDSSGGMREKEMEFLKEFLKKEALKGNYVLAGGDFNQTFPQVDESIIKDNENKWFIPYQIEDDFLPEGYSFAVDPNVWTSRLLNQSYDPSDTENTYHFIIDGFLVSNNIEVISITGLDLGFVYSDHNPVALRFKLK